MFFSHPSVCPSLSGIESWRQQPKQRSPDFPLLEFPRLSQASPETLSFKRVPGGPLGLFLLEHTWNMSPGRHPNQMPEPTQLDPLDGSKMF